ncbi:transporter substrate-binding domain-containing protein [Rhodobacterales bacterium HKCCE2091]|nr:transporter substrate-binding domain-containing protein [Rhodobacterales bacterium HKCCE2091]
MSNTLKTASQRVTATVAAGLLTLPAVAQGFPTEEIPALDAIPEIHAMLPADIQESGTISLVTDANYPPCQWFAEDGTMVGFEVDIWDALAQVMGVELDIESIDFAGLIPGVQGGRYDMAMECISDRVEREEVVTFVNHTLSYGNAFYYLADNEAITAGDPTSLCGLGTAGQSGTDFLARLSSYSDWCTEQGLEPLTIGEFPQQSAVLLALFSGRIDFALSDSSAVEEVRANNPVDIATISNPLEEVFYLGIVTAQENEELQQALLAALNAIYDAGTYDAIYEKWNLQHAALDEFGINMTTTNPLP